MKTRPSLALALLPFCAIFAQNEPNIAEKGGIVLTAPAAPTAPPTVRALIVGVSDYENELIKDLRFADRDAQVFHDFLRSKAGGEVPEANILLRTNKNATEAMVMDDLHFLATNTKPGDIVYIYFSGHGDVEKQSIWQLGYLLCHDTPFGNYPNNAIELEFLNRTITTLSVGVQAKVIVILDACRAGKLAGAENLGPSLTAKQAALQKANEVRILSCQSDQLSIESERWGGGRGVFSYFLINGLRGLAEEEGNGDILFFELKNYLRANMRKAIQDGGVRNEQTAVFVGQDEYFKLATVDSVSLFAARKEVAMPVPAASTIGLAGSREVYFAEKMGEVNQKMAALDAFAAVVGKRLAGGVAYFSTEISAGQRPADGAFRVADPHERVAAPHERGRFDEIIQPFLTNFTAIVGVPANNPTNSAGQKVVGGDANNGSEKLDEATKKGIADFLELVEKSKTDPALRQFFSQKMAVKLHDLAQKAINLYLDGDAGELARRYFKNQQHILAQYPLMLKTAMELLPETHPLREVCELKFHYFNGVCIRLQAQLALSANPADGSAELETFNPKIETALNEQFLALKLDDRAAYIHNEIGILMVLKNELPLARGHFKTAAELAPTWAAARSNLGGLQIMSGQIDSARANIERAIQLKPDYFLPYVNRGAIFEQESNYLAAETAFRKAKSVNNLHYLPFEKLAFLLLKTTRYDEAELRFKESEARKAGIISGPSPLSHVESSMFKLLLSKLAEECDAPDFLIEDPKTAADFFDNGMFHFCNDRLAEAEACFNAALKLDPDHFEANRRLSGILFQQKRYGETEILFLKLAELRPEDNFYQFQLADLYNVWGLPDREEEVLFEIVEEHEGEQDLRNALDRLAGLFDKQGRYNEEEQVLLRWRNEANGQKQPNIAAFYEKMHELFPQNADWLYKLADETWNIGDFEKVLEIDTAYAARAYVENLIGEHYLEVAENAPKAEEDILWLKNLATATAHFERSTARAPGELAPRFNLIWAYLMNFRYDDGLKILENIADSNRLDFENHCILAELRTLAGRFAEADILLKKAVYMQPQLVVGLPETLGRQQLLQGNTEAALNEYTREYLLDPAAEQPDICYTIARLRARLGQKKAATDWLDAAIKSGFKNERVIKYDADWDALREDERFLRVVGNGKFGK